MIEIVYSLKNDEFNFSSIGHANYDKIGKDIVCSAVSSIIIGALNAIKDIESFKINIQKGDVKIESIKKITQHDEIVFETMIIQLKTIENEFKSNLKITRRE